MMEAKTRNRKTFKRAEIILPEMPKRSSLFQIRPIALKSEDVESFTGYLNRISIEHCVSAGQILRHNFGRDIEALNFDISFSRRLNGLGYEAESAAEVIKYYTCLEGINYTNLTSLKNVISSSHLLRAKKVWCPACLNDDLNKIGFAYERLIWNLEIVTVCSIHQTTLFGACPYCESIENSFNIYPYGFCYYCQKWLGDSLEKKSIYEKSKNISPKQIWIEKEIRNLIKLMPKATEIFSKENYIRTLYEIVMSQYGGSITQFCGKTGLLEYEFIEFFSEGSLISLRKLVAICYTINLNMAEFLQGKTSSKMLDLDFIKSETNKNVTKEEFSKMFIDSECKILKKVSFEKIEKAKTMMEKLLKRKPIPFSKVNLIVKVDRRILQKMLPELCLELKRRYNNQKRNLRKRHSSSTKSI